MGQIILVPLVACASTLVGLQDYPKLSPFSAVRWNGEAAEVQVDEVWYALLELDDVSLSNIVVFARHKYAGKWQRRFDEDLVQVLTQMGHKPGETARLKLRRLSDGQEITLPAVPMTRENRQAIYAARRARRRRPEAKAQLTAAEAAADIEQLRQLLEQRFSYLTLKSWDYRAELEALAVRAADGITRAELGLALRRILAGLGDGHTRVRRWRSFVPQGFLPFVIDQAAEGRLVALEADGSAAVDQVHPFLLTIDGLPAENVLEVASTLVAQGSPQFVRAHGIEIMHAIQLLRRELGREQTGSVEIGLGAADGSSSTSRTMTLTDRGPAFGPTVQLKKNRFPGDIGYLKIGYMETQASFQNSLIRGMMEFRDTTGLIIDVRSNPGGSRLALRTLFPFFMSADDAPRVVNVAKYRLGPGEDPARPGGYLEDRFMFPAGPAQWAPDERQAITMFAAGFKPQWDVPETGFSDWHYMVIGPSREPGYFHYAHPVVVMLDAHCFSATDIFLGAFKGWRNVTLIGSPSGGGSGRAQEHRLDHSGIVVRISTMASFRPSGQLYDGNGIHPDVIAEPTVDDLIGVTDTVLDRAIELLTISSPAP